MVMAARHTEKRKDVISCVVQAIRRMLYISGFIVVPDKNVGEFLYCFQELIQTKMGTQDFSLFGVPAR